MKALKEYKQALPILVAFLVVPPLTLGSVWALPFLLGNWSIAVAICFGLVFIAFWTAMISGSIEQGPRAQTVSKRIRLSFERFWRGVAVGAWSSWRLGRSHRSEISKAVPNR